MKSVSLIITNYNGKGLTMDFLESLKITDYPDYEIVVVDDASTDGSVKAIRKNFPKVKVIRNKKNIGIAGAENVGIRRTKGEYLVFLDNDMLAADPSWLSHLVRAAEKKEIGSTVIMKINYHTGLIDNKGFFRKGMFSKSMFRLFGAPLMFTGAGLIKREVFEKIGLFDEKMFACFVDTDLHYRMIRAGYGVVFERKSTLLHKGGSTMTGEFRMYHHYKNKLRFILKNYRGLWKLGALGTNLLFYMIMMPYHVIRGKYRLAKIIRDSIVWNVKNLKDYV